MGFSRKAITERRNDPVRFIKSSQRRERREGQAPAPVIIFLAPKFEPSHKNQFASWATKKIIMRRKFKFNVTRQYQKWPYVRWSRCYIHLRVRIQINVPGNGLPFRFLNAKWPPQALQVCWLVPNEPPARRDLPALQPTMAVSWAAGHDKNEERTLIIYGFECISSSVGAFLLRGEVVEVCAEEGKGAVGNEGGEKNLSK